MHHRWTREYRVAHRAKAHHQRINLLSHSHYLSSKFITLNLMTWYMPNWQTQKSVLSLLMTPNMTGLVLAQELLCHNIVHRHSFMLKPSGWRLVLIDFSPAKRIRDSNIVQFKKRFLWVSNQAQKGLQSQLECLTVAKETISWHQEIFRPWSPIYIKRGTNPNKNGCSFRASAG